MKMEGFWRVGILAIERESWENTLMLSNVLYVKHIFVHHVYLYTHTYIK